MTKLTKEQNCYNIFDILPVFEINKSLLKQKYHELCKKNHPDISKENTNFHEIKKAYNTLQNDRLRAMHLCQIQKISLDDSLDSSFLSQILDYEEKIAENIDLDKIKTEINAQINECKRNYNKPVYLLKWRYYERLIDLIEKMLN